MSKSINGTLNCLMKNTGRWFCPSPILLIVFSKIICQTSLIFHKTSYLPGKGNKQLPSLYNFFNDILIHPLNYN